MYLGTQFRARNDDDYRVLAQLGVDHICGWPEEQHREWTADSLSHYREKVESFGLALDMIALPFEARLIGSEGSLAEFPNIMLGRSPERDREIDRICEMVEACSKAGIPAAKYNLSLLPVIRSQRTRGRGGSSNSTLRWAEIDQNAPPTIAGVVSADTFWARIDYFL
ncbi:MAG: mannonate dehydratase, partial [Gemmatimonadetes bacterium]|nr:mannonate dehydratase [Gemmatimonadota bacterium]